MAVRGFRAAVTVAALGMVGFAAWGVTVSAGEGVTGAAAADAPYIIEVNEIKFDPRVCIVNRLGDEVAWKNTGTQVHRIIVDDAGVDSPPRFDTGDIQPGETSDLYRFDGSTTLNYHDQYTPELKGQIIVPISNNAAANCAKETPTPTPSPTQTPTPIPTPVQKPPRCIGLVGCAVAAQVARDAD